MKINLLLSVLLSLQLYCLVDIVMTSGVEPSEFEIRARVDLASIQKVHSLPPMSVVNWELGFGHEPSTQGQLKLEVSEVVLSIIDVQNDFTNYHVDPPSGYNAALAVPASKLVMGVINKVRRAGKFPQDDTINRFCAVYRSEDYHVPGSVTFASSHCWMYASGSRFFINNLIKNERIKEFTRLKFKLVSDNDRINEPGSPWVSEEEMYVWPSHCIVGTYGQQSHGDLVTEETDRVILKAVYKYQESLTAVVDGYAEGQTIDELPNLFNKQTGSKRKLVNMTRDLAKDFPKAKYIIVMGFEYMNCVAETAKSLAKIAGNNGNGQKYTVIIVTDGVGYFADPENERRKSVTAELRELNVVFVKSKALSFTFGEMVNSVESSAELNNV